MQNDQTPELPDELNDFVKELASFEAYSSTANHDQLMFQAGQFAARAELQADASSIRRTLRIWQSLALVLFASSLGLGMSLALRPEQQARAVTAEHVRPPTGTEETSGRVTDTGSANESASIAPRQTHEKHRIENSRGADSGTPASPVNEGLHTRLALVERMIDVTFSPERTPATSEEPQALANQSTPAPILSHRSLLQGEGSRIFINRLIEEPNL